MSKFYEVRNRNGAARIGKLWLKGGNQRQTPLMLRAESEEEIEVINGEDWSFKELSLEETWNTARGTILLPEVHPLSQKAKSTIPSLMVDFFVLSFASDMLNSPRDFVRRVIEAKKTIPPDVALWVPSIAMPENIALLVYMGVDIIDDTNAVIKGYQGIYQMEECEVNVSELEELPCNCSVCSSRDVEDLKRRDIAEHNVLLLDKEVKKVKASIRGGNLREYVEMRVRSSVFLTAVLRFLDSEEEYFERRTQIAGKQCMKATSMESLKRIEVKRFARRVKERYEPSEKKILLILPCSARKPYSTSRSHARFIEAIEDYRGAIQEIILTSPLGVVPRALELIYPAAFYDIPVTGYWDAEEREWVGACLRTYLEQNFINGTIVAHVNGAYKEICTSVAEDLGIERKIVYSCEEGEEVTSKEALERLRNCISELSEKKRLSGFEMKTSMIKAMADYQFGIGVGGELVERKEGEKMKIVGKYPYYKFSLGGDVLARIVPEYGLLALTMKGARKIENYLSSYRVEIGDFVPKGSILAPGVLDADEQIRVNDEVVFWGEKAFGVGRAKMSGWEMVESRRGVAVQVRAVEEI